MEVVWYMRERGGRGQWRDGGDGRKGEIDNDSMST